MSEQNSKSRFAIDLDDLERQLRSSPAQDVKQPAADPLAELAKLVGQDDPFKDMFRASTPAQPTPYAQPAPYAQNMSRVEPMFEASPNLAASQAGPNEGSYAEHDGFAVPQDDLRGALDEFDAIFDKSSHVAAGAAQAEPFGHGHGAEATSYAAHDGFMAHAGADVSQARPADARASVDDLDDMISRDLERIIDESRHAETATPPQFDGYSSGTIAGAALAGSAISARAGQAVPSSMSGSAPGSMPDYGDAYPEDEAPKQKRGMGKGAITAAVLVALGIGGVGAAAVWRGTGKSAGAEPPTIKADVGPSKVQPQNPGGAEFPDQNKRIYERGGASPPSDTKVVNREEQPVDVQAAARSAARVIVPGAALSAGAQPAETTPSPSAATSALGEPRKVRTVLIRPDGTIAGAAPASQVAAPPATQAAPVAEQRTASASAATTPAATTPTAPANSPAIIRQQAPKPAVQAKPAPQETAASLPINPPVAARPAPARVAAAPAADSAPGGGGNYTVQLGAPGSEEEARSTFASLQRRYPDELGGQRALIRKADVGGREVYRLRVGALSSAEATELCNKLKARGGQCFIARN